MLEQLSPSTVELDGNEAEIIAKLARELLTFDPVGAADRYVLEAQHLSAMVPARVRRRLLEYRRFGSDTGALILRNVPVGDVPATPGQGDLGQGVRLPAGAAMSVLAAHLGDQFGFLPEQLGLIVQDMVPVAGVEETQQSTSSCSLLELHCETVFTEYRPDFIGLFCIRADPQGQAGTLLSPIGSVLRRVEPTLVEVLWQPRFKTTVNTSFLRGSGIPGPVVVKPIRILTGSADEPRLRCDFAETRGIDPIAQIALDQLYAAASEVATEFRLSTGDLVLVDNHRSFHGRTPFTRYGDGTDGWLLRTFIARDLDRSGADRPGNGRTIDVDYSRLRSGGPA